MIPTYGAMDGSDLRDPIDTLIFVLNRCRNEFRPTGLRAIPTYRGLTDTLIFTLNHCRNNTQGAR